MYRYQTKYIERFAASSEVPITFNQDRRSRIIGLFGILLDGNLTSTDYLDSFLPFRSRN
jgi:hypothetical protein